MSTDNKLTVYKLIDEKTGNLIWETRYKKIAEDFKKSFKLATCQIQEVQQ